MEYSRKHAHFWSPTIARSFVRWCLFVLLCEPSRLPRRWFPEEYFGLLSPFQRGRLTSYWSRWGPRLLSKDIMCCSNRLPCVFHNSRFLLTSGSICQYPTPVLIEIDSNPVWGKNSLFFSFITEKLRYSVLHTAWIYLQYFSNPILEQSFWYSWVE